MLGAKGEERNLTLHECLCGTTDVYASVNVKTYVMCTLRAAPDYLSFDQSHHQTIIFQAESKLLTLLEPELEPEL